MAKKSITKADGSTGATARGKIAPGEPLAQLTDAEYERIATPGADDIEIARARCEEVAPLLAALLDAKRFE